MGWETSQRRNELPADWQAIRQRIGTRDRWTCQKCGKPGRHCDHITPGGPDTEDNLQILCQPCHMVKSRSEGGRAARKGYRTIVHVPRQRPTEEHPGLR